MTRTITSLLLLVLAGCGGAPARTQVADEAVFDTEAPAAAEAPELIEVRVLLIAYQGAQGAAPEVTRTKEQAQARAQLMGEMARGGEAMTTLVPEYSEHSSRHGALGLFKLRTADPAPLSQAIVDAALVLPVGGISRPVETPEGYWVIERNNDPLPGPEEIAARHILIAYAGSPQAVGNATRTEAEALARAEEALAKARAEGADWNAIAAEYTDEPGSDRTGGDLGTFGRGRMVPAFERAAFKLQVNEISDVIQSPFGFHVIQRYR